MSSEKSTSLSIEQAYALLKNVLLKNKCKITEEKQPKYIAVKQGSLNGILPGSAKKTVCFNLTSDAIGTKIVSFSRITNDWKYLTLFGTLFAAVLVAVFLWVAVDMEKYLETAKASYWTWLAPAFGYPDFSKTLFTINVTRAAAIFLFATVIFEVVAVPYVYPRKNAFAQQTLQKLP